MAYNTAQVTDAGNALFAQILANKSSLSIDRIEISNVQLAASTVLTSMTKIDNVVQTTGANGLQKSGNSFIISTAVSNASVTADYQAWVFGIWGSDSANGTSTLIEVITTTGTPDTIPAYSGSTPVTYNYKFATALSNASSISLSMLNDAYATNDTVLHTSGDETSTGTKTFEKIEVSNDNTPDVVLTDGASISLDNGESKFTPSNDSTVVHKTGDETIDGQKKFDTDPTDGVGNAYAKTVDVNQQLDKKVTDNKDGTEQLNGVKVQPFNKLSDTIGGRNLLINTAQLNDSTVCLYKKSNISDTYLGLNIYQTNSKYDGEKIYWSYLAPKLKTNTNYVMSEYVRNTSPTKATSISIYGAEGGAEGGVVANNNWGPFATLPPNSGWTRISALVNIASFPTTFPTTILWVLRFENVTALTDGYVQFAGLKFEQGSIATDWTPAPEDKVNVADMRKPASDVAGIEEVNAKQDKLTITPADDSKVAHLSGANNFDTVPTVNNNPLLLASSLPSDLARTGQDTNFTGKLQQAGSDVVTQGKFVQSDSETDAQSASSNDSSGFYYTEEAD